MNKIDKEVLLSDAWSLKIAIDDSEVDYFLNEVNAFISNAPTDINYDNIEPMRFVNTEVINVFSSIDLDSETVKVEDLLSNAPAREGNYVKVPKVLK